MAYIRAELKQDAKKKLQGKWGAAIGALLLITAISCAVSYLSYLVDGSNQDPASITPFSLLIAVVSLLIFSPLDLGYTKMQIMISRNQDVRFYEPF